MHTYLQRRALNRDFQNNEDVHTTTAVRVFGLDGADEVTPNMRRDAKAVNFGIVYGISDYGLSQNLNISRAEAREYIDTYFERFPGVKEYIDNIIREAKDQGMWRQFSIVDVTCQISIRETLICDHLLSEQR